MKILLCIWLSFPCWGSDLRLFANATQIWVNDLTNAIQLFASADLRRWKLVAEFTNSLPFIATNKFLRARAKPPPPTLECSVSLTGRLVRISGVSSKPLTSLWLTNGPQVVKGWMTRQIFEGSGVSPEAGQRCLWQFEMFSVAPGKGSATAHFTDVDGYRVSTNLTWNCEYTMPTLTINFPEEGTELLGNSVMISGFTDNLADPVMVNGMPARVSEGQFVCRMPVQASNCWTVSCGGLSRTVHCPRSTIYFTSSAQNWTSLYGERGWVLSGSIDPAYDVMVDTNRVISTNGFWRTIIISPSLGNQPFKLAPKGASSQGGSAGGTVEAWTPWPTYYAYALNETRAYKDAPYTDSSQLLYAGTDKTNYLYVSRLVAGYDRLNWNASYSGAGELLLLTQHDGPRDFVSKRMTFPACTIAQYLDDNGSNSIGCHAVSGCIMDVGGDPMDPKQYRFTVSFEASRVAQRDGSEVYYEEMGTPGWIIGAHPHPWAFVAFNGFKVDVSPTFPPLYGDCWAQYSVTCSKENP